jgi:hypothetical protein
MKLWPHNQIDTMEVRLPVLKDVIDALVDQVRAQKYRSVHPECGVMRLSCLSTDCWAS